MQHEPRGARRVAVKCIPEDRGMQALGMGSVNPDLVRAAGDRHELDP